MIILYRKSGNYRRFLPVQRISEQTDPIFKIREYNVKNRKEWHVHKRTG